MKRDYILVFDYGSQYNQLIVRRVRELNVYSELVDHNVDVKKLQDDPHLKGIILSGGPNSVYADGAFDIDDRIFGLGIPVLGICYGMQLMMHKLGGKVEPGTVQEFGKTDIDVISDTSVLFEDTQKHQVSWMSHTDKVVAIPDDFYQTAESNNTEFVAVENQDRNLYGIQFHPEVTHSEYGMQIIENFLELCNIQDEWTMENFVDELIENVRSEVGDKKVLCALSGGVDSSVVAALLSKAIGKQLICVFVNNGLLRKDEDTQVVDTFSKMDLELIYKNEEDLFLQKLEGVVEPEAKRKIIGNTFIDVFDDVASVMTNVDYLAQGTIYADVIESGTGTAETIKSHHNVGGLPDDMQFKLIEPLRLLFKDEVRKLGSVLGLSDAIVQRQPFPGPGLGIRILGDVTKEKTTVLKEVDAIIRDEFAKDPEGQAYGSWQYFGVLTGAKSVGVVGDKRAYGEVVAIRSVTSVDGMSADFSRIDYEVLGNMATRIINEVPEVARVVYDITSKPPGTIEWE